MRSIPSLFTWSHGGGDGCSFGILTIVTIIIPKLTVIWFVQFWVLKWLIFGDISIIAGIRVLVFIRGEQLWVALILPPSVAMLILHATISIDVRPWQLHAVLLGR